MANTKISALANDPAPASTDVTVTIDDTVGTPISKKVTWGNIATLISGLSPFASMAQQAASSVAITGGTLAGITSFASTASQATFSQDVTIGSATALSGMNPRLDVQAGGQNGIHVTGANLGLDFVATEYGKAAVLDLRSSNGTSLSALSHTLNGDQIGKIHIGGSLDASLIDVGYIRMLATQDFSGTSGTASCGSAWQFGVTKNGTDGSTQYAAWQMDNDGSLFVPVSRTYTAAPSALFGIRSGITLTANYASQKLPTAIEFAGDRVMTTAGAAGANPNSGFVWAPTYKNANAVAADLAASSLGASTNGFWEKSVIQADGATIQIGLHRSFVSTPTISAINSGALVAAGAYYGLFSGPTITDCTLTTSTGVRINNPTLSGTGAVTTAYGLDIQAITSATTNVGIRNASTLRQVAASTFGADAAATANTTVDIQAGTIGLRNATASRLVGDVTIGADAVARTGTSLDIQGGGLMAMTMSTMALSNGANNDVTLPTSSVVTITGPTGAFSITGIAGGVDGMVLYIINRTGQNMTITNEDAGSTAANRINTLIGGSVVTTGDGAQTLMYDATTDPANPRWVRGIGGVL